MAVTPVPFDPTIKEMVLEVIQNARKQEYTPEKLCQLQKVIEAKYYYWWIMDMKKEEYACELFDDDFTFYCYGPTKRDKKDQAMASKWVNAPMQTMHMGHQPLVWLIDDNHARGVFQYEDHHTYMDEPEKTVEEWMVYCDDFVKDEKGVWHISALRMAFRKLDGSFRDPVAPPEGWVPEEWEEV